ncbi:MAG: response regulator [Myxococcota bacterium]|nr:response regulator [Myxococcota bacterium]
MNKTDTRKTIAVLLVEDSTAVAMQIREFLEETQNTRFEIEHAKDLVTAMNAVVGGGFNVILLDLGLPDSDGLDTFIRLHEVAPDVATVVFTGINDEAVALDALRQGAQDYLVKGQVDGGLITRAIRYAIERKQAEEAIRESEEKHRTLLEAMPDIVYKIDPNGYVKYINRAISGLGYTPEELLGRHFSVIIHPDDLEGISRYSVLPKFAGRTTGYRNAPKLLDERRTGKRLTKDLTLRLIPKGWDETDESELVIGSLTSYGEISAAGHYLTNERTNTRKFSGTVGIIKDITERRRAEEEKAALENQLQHSQKMEAIGRLAGGVAHDMNNVLGAILGSASVIELEIEPDDTKRADIENILVACRKGRDLTRDLLGFARKGKYVKESIHLNDIATEAKALLTRTIAKKISVETILDEELNLIEGDRSQIHHALMNVCINAADAMEGPSRLTITTRNTLIDKREAMKLDGLDPGKYVELKVIDTGVGMDAKTLQMVFEPFFTTKPKGEGTGLGLSMVYGVIKNHGGSVAIESEPNVGTTVAFLLPAFERADKRRSEPAVGKPSSKPDRGGILLVDDETIIRTSARRLLEKLGYTVYLADNGMTALEIYRKHESDISLVLLDLIMPEMDGPETFEALIKINPEVKVLLLSGYSKDEKIEKLLDDGAIGFVQKPFDLRTLSDTVKTAFN